MARDKTGCIVKRKDRPGLWVRVKYKDEAGNEKVVQRKVDNRTEGKLVIKKLLREIEDHGAKIIDGDRLTFAKLAEQYRERKLQPPTYKGETKVSGLRSYDSQRRRLATLIAYFGNKRIRNINHADIEKFKLTRLKDRNKRRPDDELKVATVNRELQLLRAVFNFARRQGWVTRNPFEQGESLISLAQETKRERILTREEEELLLAACTGRRAHLKAILICALDTALRRNEILSLRWKDVDLSGRLIVVRAATTKTLRDRTVGITDRLAVELQRLSEVAPDDPECLVFGYTDFKRSFEKACAEAGVEGFRFHDCRHAATTRMIQSGMPPAEVVKITGHSQIATFLRYVNTDGQAAQRAAMALDDWHAEGGEAEAAYIN